MISTGGSWLAAGVGGFGVVESDAGAAGETPWAGA